MSILISLEWQGEIYGLCGTNAAFKDHTSKELSFKENLVVHFVHECNRLDSIIFQSCVKNAQQVPKMSCQVN